LFDFYDEQYVPVYKVKLNCKEAMTGKKLSWSQTNIGNFTKDKEQ